LALVDAGFARATAAAKLAKKVKLKIQQKHSQISFAGISGANRF
jgi:hypothetical protein